MPDMSNKNWNDRADKDLFFTILSVKNIGVISGGEWTTIGNHMRSIGYGFTNEGCRQHFQGLRRAQNKADANTMAGLEHLNQKTPNKADPTLNPITRRPGPGRGRPRKTPQKGEGAADGAVPDGSDIQSPVAGVPGMAPAPGPGVIPGPSMAPSMSPGVPQVAGVPVMPGMQGVPSAPGIPPAPMNQGHPQLQSQPQPHLQAQFQIQGQPQGQLQGQPQTPVKKPRARKSRAKQPQDQSQLPPQAQGQMHAQAQAQAQAHHQAQMQAQVHAQGHMPPRPVNMVTSRVAPPAQMESPGDEEDDDDDDDLAVDPTLGDGDGHPSKRPRLDDSQGTSSMDDEAMMNALAAHNAPTPADYSQEFNYGEA